MGKILMKECLFVWLQLANKPQILMFLSRQKKVPVAVTGNEYWKIRDT